jgi:hypothetical protein
MKSSNSPEPIYYVYAYLREDGSPYYIGKGKNKRAYSNKHAVNLPPHQRIIFLAKSLYNSEAILLEKKLIKEFGRKDNGTGILRNLTDGGEGTTGRRGKHKILRSPEHKLKISAALKGKSRGRMRESEKKKRSIALNGIKRNDEFKIKHSGSNNGRHDDNVYTFRHVDTGEIIHRTHYQMRVEYNFINGKLNAMKNGERKQHRGWELL